MIHSRIILAAASLAGLMATVGCTCLVQHAVTIDPDGTKHKVWCCGGTVLDAKQTFDKMRASAAKTASVGITAMDQESSGSNVAAIVGAAAEGTAAGIVRGMKTP